jgi:pyrroloquinoline quinone (PQQ) biosynthesis protein C
MSAFFAELVVATDESRRAFETNAVILESVANGLPLARYRALLLELSQVVWHFNPICAAAASRLTDQHRALRYFLYDHMQEESGHEQWVVNDLRAIGASSEQLETHVVSPFTLAMNGYNYCTVDRGHPVSVLGMLYTFEVIASVYGGPFASAVKEALLLDGDTGVTFINSHATMDVKHMVELRKILDTVEDGAAKAAVCESTRVNFHLLTHLFSSV